MVINSNYTELSKIISSVQSDIADLCENLHYKKLYMHEEVSYWDNISKWLYEDRNRIKVKRCLDIGCGYGTLLLLAQKIYGCSIYGMDLTNSFISNKLIEKYGMDFKICNVETDIIPWVYNFDLIFLTEVIEHFNFNVEPTLIKIREKLSDNGILYLSTPDAKWYGKITDYYKTYKDMPPARKDLPIKDCHIYVFDEHELMELFDSVGFKIEKYGQTYGHHLNFKLKKGWS